jgi:Icc-related predicted phosphoesterase
MGFVKYLTGAVIAGMLVSGSSALAAQSADFNNDGKIRFAHVSDLEGAISECEHAAKDISDKNPDMIFITGDTYENEGIRRNPLFPHSTDNLKEMVDGITPFAELGVPVYVIPGNHESTSIYEEGIHTLQESYPNVHDISGQSIDLDGLNIVGFAGYYHPRFTARDGFVNKKADYVNAFEQIRSYGDDDDMTVFVTHSPPFINPQKHGNSSIDYVQGAGHVGDKNITAILEHTEVLNLCGHIHEGGSESAKVGRSFSYNGASVTPYMAEGESPRATVFERTEKGIRFIK